jgi:hypothetical protein
MLSDVNWLLQRVEQFPRPSIRKQPPRISQRREKSQFVLRHLPPRSTTFQFSQRLEISCHPTSRRDTAAPKCAVPLSLSSTETEISGATLNCTAALWAEQASHTTLPSNLPLGRLTGPSPPPEVEIGQSSIASGLRQTIAHD